MDNDRSNNDPRNLRAVCRACNVFRAHTPTSMGVDFFEINGTRMTASAWARMDAVNVTSGTILARRRRGMSDYEAVFGEKKICKSIVPKKNTKKYDKLRGIEWPPSVPKSSD